MSLRNERGSISILIALGVVSMAALVTLQMSSAYRTVHVRQTADKIRFNVSQTMQQLAMYMKQARAQALLDPTCAIAGSSAQPRTIEGVTFCLPNSGRYCVSIPQSSGSPIEACASSDETSLKWRSGSAASPAFGVVVNRPAPAGAITNRITIPAQTNTRIWRSCVGAECVRIALCPESNPACAPNEAIALQVIRLGDLP